MAFSGLHVTFGFAGARGVIEGTTTGNSNQPVFRMAASETMASAGTSTSAAPASSSYAGEPIARVVASADSFVCFAPTPNATSGVRDFLPALEVRDYVVREGDKVAWILA